MLFINNSEFSSLQNVIKNRHIIEAILSRKENGDEPIRDKVAKSKRTNATRHMLSKQDIEYRKRRNV